MFILSCSGFSKSGTGVVSQHSDKGHKHIGKRSSQSFRTSLSRRRAVPFTFAWLHVQPIDSNLGSLGLCPFKLLTVAFSLNVPFNMMIDDSVSVAVDLNVSLVDGNFICISKQRSNFFQREATSIGVEK